MTASGSDVDELYGTIWAVASNQGRQAISYSSSHASRREGGAIQRAKTDIWFSPENANVGRGLATITIGMRGQATARDVSTQADSVRIRFGVKDEDDGRGGGNDEVFVLTTGGEAGYPIKTPMPGREEAPEFTREARLTLHARSNGNNRLNLTLHVRWYRETGI